MFTYYGLETVPSDSKVLIEEEKARIGLIPNMNRIFAAAPVTYWAYVKTYQNFLNNGTLSVAEQQVVMMTASFHNNCHYCVLGHRDHLADERV